MKLIYEGTPGYIRFKGGVWEPHKARKNKLYADEDIRPYKSGVYVVIRQGDWEFMVSAAHLDHQPKKKFPEKPEQFGTFNRCILGRNGRGANRRHNQKRRRK